MKPSKILIFVLSVILLIVVIKCVRGCRSREGFADFISESINSKIGTNKYEISTNRNNIRKNIYNIGKNTSEISNNRYKIANNERTLKTNIYNIKKNTELITELITTLAGRVTQLDNTLTSYKATQKVTDDNQDAALISYKTFQSDIDNGQNSKFDSYKATQQVIDDTQTKDLASYKTLQQVIDDTQTKDLASYKTLQQVTDEGQNAEHSDHIKAFKTLQASAKDTDGQLVGWQNMFETAQIDLGLKIKCQNTDTGEWGDEPNEFCPAWLSG